MLTGHLRIARLKDEIQEEIIGISAITACAVQLCFGESHHLGRDITSVEGRTEHGNSLSLPSEVAASNQYVALNDGFDIEGNGSIRRAAEWQIILTLRIRHGRCRRKDQIASLEDLQIWRASEFVGLIRGRCSLEGRRSLAELRNTKSNRATYQQQTTTMKSHSKHKTTNISPTSLTLGASLMIILLRRSGGCEGRTPSNMLVK
mmetsp:Transcript_33148/g.97782  ORF Transcript_33148/g.97782 Transcript_33148/m.97782 type:complete len:204 (+) Transcript_33148:963-1574(+)